MVVKWDFLEAACMYFMIMFLGPLRSFVSSGAEKSDIHNLKLTMILPNTYIKLICGFFGKNCQGKGNYVDWRVSLLECPIFKYLDT